MPKCEQEQRQKKEEAEDQTRPHLGGAAHVSRYVGDGLHIAGGQQVQTVISIYHYQGCVQ